jgi:hypothetical protein
LIQGFGGVQMQVFADLEDGNSVKIAETLRSQFAKERWTVNKKVLPLDASTPPQHGIHIVFPSADLTFNFEGMIDAFKECELETKVDVRVMKQPPTILRIEVWPSKFEPPPFPIGQLIR